MMLDDDVIGKGSGVHLLHVTHDIMEGHRDLKVQGVGDVIDARIGLGFGVDFPVEQLGRLHDCNHFSRSAQDGNCFSHMTVIACDHRDRHSMSCVCV